MRDERLMRGVSARAALRHPSVLVGRRDYVFVLGHMRSYSSVLCHVLGSHPEISGYGEMRLAYGRPRDLLRLRARVAGSLGAAPKGRLVLDKILHNPYVVAPSMLDGAAPINPIFLVRRPAETLPSIVRMAERLGYEQWTGVEGAAAYYAERLAGLERLGGLCRYALVLRAEELITNTTATLEAIARFLHLREPLRSQYSTFPDTGVAGRGDYTDALRSGEILRPEAEAAPQPIPKDVLAEAELAYARCMTALTGAFGEAFPSACREPGVDVVRHAPSAVANAQ
jgi:hypothetical protein